MRHLLFFTVVFLISQNLSSQNNSPEFVGRPPQNAYTGLVLLENGEVRHYGNNLFIRSSNKGESWDSVFVSNGNHYGKQSPITKEFIRLYSGKNDSVFSLRSEGGIDGQWKRELVDTNGAIMLKPAIFVNKGRRAIIGFHTRHRNGCGSYYSDDHGKSWKKSAQIEVPHHKPGGFHKGTRWNHGAVEPTIVELQDGHLWMIIRTAQDNHWESFSNNNGESWSKPKPSRFYGTITMPTFQRLNNGDLLFIWSNTTPLPERKNVRGVWEDVFTNRDAIHAALSKDDGKTWFGFREIYLNPLRNDSLMATRFGKQGSLDRSVHQSECIELNDSTVLISLGQHPEFRALIKLNLKWLLETSRFDDFSEGLKNWSTQKYINGIKGHCAYNRTTGAVLKQHPDYIDKTVMHLWAEKDTNLVSENSGALFNFPSGKKGEVSFRIQFNPGFEGMEINLHDRWFNPCDTTAKHYAMHSFKIPKNLDLFNKKKLNTANWYNIKLSWNKTEINDSAICKVFIDDHEIEELQLNKISKNGISYIHFLLPVKTNNDGILIESISVKTQ